MLLINSNKIISQCSPVAGEISGKVLNDVNFNDIIDAFDRGLEGIEVVAYDKHQTVLSKDTTDANGYYNLKGLSDGSVYRLEYKYSELFIWLNHLKI